MIALEDMPIVAQTTGTRTYDELCEDSRVYVDVGDVAAWKIGDNACEVLERWHDKTLADYAMEIRKPKGTIAEFRAMSAYFDETVRAELYAKCPGISRSHMRKVLSIKDKSLGRSFVEHAARKGWTVDQFGHILKRYKRIKGIGRAGSTAPRKKSAEFDATYHNGAYNVELLNAVDVVAIDKLTAQYNCTISVIVSWTEETK